MALLGLGLQRRRVRGQTLTRRGAVQVGLRYLRGGRWRVMLRRRSSNRWSGFLTSWLVIWTSEIAFERMHLWIPSGYALLTLTTKPMKLRMLQMLSSEFRLLLQPDLPMSAARIACYRCTDVPSLFRYSFRIFGIYDDSTTTCKHSSMNDLKFQWPQYISVYVRLNKVLSSQDKCDALRDKIRQTNTNVQFPDET